MEKVKINFILIIVFLSMTIFGQKVEFNNNHSTIQSLPYNSIDNIQSEVIVTLKDIKNHFTLNAIDWVYNSLDELWIKIECWDWSTAECCDCYATKIYEGWIPKKNITSNALFSKILKPITFDLNSNENFILLNKEKKITSIKEGFYGNSFGGTLFIYDYDFLWINLDGEMVKLESHNPSIIPNIENINFQPYSYFFSKYNDIEIKIYTESQHNPYIEINQKDKSERILLTNYQWNGDEY
tara:strand:- start:9223 stop:9942 length:720 start_codon:yes stop_codon:yes gene_type:complete